MCLVKMYKKGAERDSGLRTNNDYCFTSCSKSTYSPFPIEKFVLLNKSIIEHCLNLYDRRDSKNGHIFSRKESAKERFFN